MAWTTPVNVATGDVLTATRYNEEVVGNAGFLFKPPMASLYRAAALSNTAPSAYQSIAWDTQEFTNTDSMWVIGTPTRITLATAGIYMVTATVTFAASAVGLRALQLQRSGVAYAYGTLVPGSAVINYMNMTALVESDGTHYIEMFSTQSTAGNLAYSVGAANMRFGATWVGNPA